MDKLCNVVFVVAKGWQREQGQGMPGKCLNELASCRGSFRRPWTGAWKPRKLADGGECETGAGAAEVV